MDDAIKHVGLTKYPKRNQILILLRDMDGQTYESVLCWLEELADLVR